MSAIRDTARTVLADLPEEGEVQSLRDAVLFGTLTNGVTHKTLQEDWRFKTDEEKKRGLRQGSRTVCIDFVCWYASRMNIGLISSIPKDKRDITKDGFFMLQETLIKAGKGHAYVAATKDGPAPEYGDILRHKSFHVDISLGLDKGGVLHRAAGGQSVHSPRPKLDTSDEYDNVKCVVDKGPYRGCFANLQGWLDLDLFFGPPPGFDASLAWLYGWWSVTDGSQYYYYFSAGGNVLFTTSKPADTSGPPKSAKNYGTFTFRSPKEVKIRWNKVAGVADNCWETFYNAAPGCRTMHATSTLYGPLRADRM